jgi:hypothetical protein
MPVGDCSTYHGTKHRDNCYGDKDKLCFKLAARSSGFDTNRILTDILRCPSARKTEECTWPYSMSTRG